MNLHDLAIIVPTKNEEKNIIRFLKSIPEHLEVILVDASSDQTVEIAKKLRPSIQIITQTHRNIAEARQIGAQYAKKKWLLFTDADVHFSKNYFAFLKRVPIALAYYGSKYSKSTLYKGYDTAFEIGQTILHNFGIPAASGSNMIVHKKTFWRIGGFDTTLQCNEDTELFYRLARKKAKIYHDPKLKVTSHDDRRLKRGVIQKWIHTFTRCIALYFNVLNKEQKSQDWGYWNT